MALFLAMSPGLLWFGPVLLTLGLLGLMVSRFGRRELMQVTMTGLVVTMVGIGKQLAVGFPGAAHASGSDQVGAVQAAMLSGMGSQIVYE
jgi:hypothetical protein